MILNRLFRRFTAAKHSEQYDMNAYWQKRGKSYRANFNYTDDFIRQESELVQFIRKHKAQTGLKSVLEAGCGFGRITDLFLWNFKYEVSMYDAIDLSDAQVQAAKRLVHDSRVHFSVSTIADFQPSRTEKYDLVLAVEVLMHIPPDQIASHLSRLLNLGRHLIHVDLHAPAGKVLLPHNFSHDYDALYSQVGAQLVDRRLVGKQVIDLIGSAA